MLGLEGRLLCIKIDVENFARRKFLSYIKDCMDDIVYGHLHCVAKISSANFTAIQRGFTKSFFQQKFTMS